MAAQISADLFRMKAELEHHLSNHNDLHADNIIVHRLSGGMYRQGAMDPSIRAVAIDLGSVGPDRRSGGGYLGDLHWIAQHIQGLVDQLLGDLESLSDLERAGCACPTAGRPKHITGSRAPADTLGRRLRASNRSRVLPNCRTLAPMARAAQTADVWSIVQCTNPGRVARPQITRRPRWCVARTNQCSRPPGGHRDARMR